MPDITQVDITACQTTPAQSSLISIGTHNLAFDLTPNFHNKPPTPTLIIFPGASTTRKTWYPLSTLLSQRLKIHMLLYDRSGIGLSEHRPVTTPNKKTNPINVNDPPGQQDAAELSLLLKALKLKGPYILLAHSYGGCVAREFLHEHDADVVGMVLCETGTETRCQWHEEQYAKCVLGTRPLSVIRGAAAFKGVRSAVGTAGKTEQGLDLEKKAMFEAMARTDEELKKEQLRLSRRGRFRSVEGVGHCLHLQVPEVVVEEVGWVLGNLVGGEGRSGEEGVGVGNEERGWWGLEWLWRLC